MIIEIQICGNGPLRTEEFCVMLCIDKRNGEFDYTTNSFIGTKEEAEAEASRLLEAFPTATIQRFGAAL